MPNYKLIYFNYTGLAEPIRFVLHQSGIKFEDERIVYENWPKIKTKMPMQQLPVLDIDGKIYYQTKAICRLIAKRNNLYGSNDDEAYEIDAIVDTIDDFRQAFTQYHWENDETQKEKLKTIRETKRQFCLQKFEEQVKKNGGFFVAGKLSWADLMYAAHCDMLSTMLGSDLNKDYPELTKMVERVRALPNIKAYLKIRPKTNL